MLPVPNPEVIYKPVTGSGVLLDSKQEVYFGLNSVGVRIWELLPPACGTLDEMCVELRKHYPDVDSSVLRADVTQLLDDLRAHGLVASDPNEAANASTASDVANPSA